jgi:hypothetical protein
MAFVSSRRSVSGQKREGFGVVSLRLELNVDGYAVLGAGICIDSRAKVVYIDSFGTGDYTYVCPTF